MSSPLINGIPLLKSVLFSSSSSLPPLVREGGGLVCESDHSHEHSTFLFSPGDRLNAAGLLLSLPYFFVTL